MLLQALFELSQQRNLVPDYGYSTEPCHYVMRISADGKLLSLEENLQRILVPQAKSRASDIAPRFFVDNVKYVFGLGGELREDKDKEKKRLTRLTECFEAFHAQVLNAAVQTRDDAGAVAYVRLAARIRAWKGNNKSVENHPDLLPLLALAPKAESATHPDGWTGSEVIVCHLGDEEIPMFQRPQLREEWARLLILSEEGRMGRCMITGKLSPVLDKHFPIKGLPGAQASGAFLCCYDKPAFTSQGAVQGENACISREGAVGYAAALNWLLARTPERRHRGGIQIGDQAVMVAWSAYRSEFNPSEKVFDAIAPSPEAALQYPASAWSGMAPDPELDASMFFAAILSPNASRVVVRDFIYLPLPEIKKNILRYHEDLRFGENPKPISLWLIHRALNLQMARDQRTGGTQLSAMLATSWIQAALKGTPYPTALLTLALQRLSDPSLGVRLSETCCAVMKAVLLRMPGQKREITVALDENNTDMPYLLGRLFAVMERLQEVAIPGIGAGIRKTHFAAAFHSPANTYPSLLALSAHHAAKTENKRRFSGRWLENMKLKIIDQMPQKFPARLLPVDQGQWHIGYGQQLAALNAPRQPVVIVAPQQLRESA